ncbi:MAG: LysM peptidoglycan-binding domain-containing protein [Bdellovibrionaceae bacterium]|nr:LysM peptidoglycan-binding domain-containing protein [Pseudobdellovibrionaceae bacterium]
MKGVEVEAIRGANGLQSDALRVGQKLVIPGAGAVGGTDGRAGAAGHLHGGGGGHVVEDFRQVGCEAGGVAPGQ